MSAVEAKGAIGSVRVCVKKGLERTGQWGNQHTKDMYRYHKGEYAVIFKGIPKKAVGGRCFPDDPHWLGVCVTMGKGPVESRVLVEKDGNIPSPKLLPGCSQPVQLIATNHLLHPFAPFLSTRICYAGLFCDFSAARDFDAKKSLTHCTVGMTGNSS